MIKKAEKFFQDKEERAKGHEAWVAPRLRIGQFLKARK